MPQYPLVPVPGGTATTLDVTAANTIIKNSPGRLFTVTVCGTTTGSALGAVYDSASATGNTAANQVAVIPEAPGTYTYAAIPTANGLVVTPPTGVTCVSVSWS